MPYMRRPPIRFICKVLLCIGLLICIIRMQFVSYSRRKTEQSAAIQKTEVSAIPNECLCKYKDGDYDFCYHLPASYSIYGKRFNCNYLPVLDSLGLLDTGNEKEDYISMTKNPVFVTAFSSNHYAEGTRLLYEIRSLWPKQFIIVYDLGLASEQTEIIQKLCDVQYRVFNFSAYPNYFTLLSQFRWKPVIIAETLKEFGSIWYMDTSVVFKKDNLSHVYDLVRCRQNVQNSARSVIPSSELRDEREQRTEHESGWDINQWRENVKECQKSAYLLHGYTGHGIFWATDPVVYEYFPTNFVEIKKPKAKMYEAGFVFVAKTREVITNILRWYVACALEQQCMAGTYGLHCSSTDSKRFSVFAKCHRFDQSVVNLLSANAYYYDRHYYVSEIVDFFNIVRGSTYHDLKPLMKC